MPPGGNGYDKVSEFLDHQNSGRDHRMFCSGHLTQVQGRMDVSFFMVASWRLARRWSRPVLTPISYDSEVDQ